MKQQYIVYRIYSASGLDYVGQTAQPLDRRLHRHFFAKPMMRKLDSRTTTRIEYAICRSRADMNLYEIYYIEKLKPPFNSADRHPDELAIELPELDFIEHDCKLLGKWRRQADERDAAAIEREKERIKAEFQKATLRQQRRAIGYDEYCDEMEKLKGEAQADDTRTA
jgi:hypothetical protein